MSQPTSLQYRFGEFCLDVAERRLLRRGVTISLAPKVFDTLLLLVGNSGHLIEKEEFMRKLWPDTFVGDDALARNISILRKVTGGTSDSQSVIATVPKRGYRFVAEIDHNGSKSGDFQTADLWHIAKALDEQPAPPRQQTITPTPVQPPGSNANDISAVTTPIAARAPSPSWLRPVPFVVFTLILGALAGVLTFYLFHPAMSSDLQDIRMTKLTNHGAVTGVAISPDGRYVAYAKLQGEKQGLWMHQIASQSDVQILSAGPGFHGLTFTPDGNYIYFVRSDENNEDFKYLYSIPVMGGPVKKLFTDVDSPASFSPDGRRFVYEHCVEGRDDIELRIATADGTDDHVLAMLHNATSLLFQPGPNWSPDGRAIIVPVVHVGPRSEWALDVVSVSDGTVRKFFSRPDPIGRPVWMRGDRLLVPFYEPVGQRAQLWSISYPEGKPQRFTNDLTSYGSELDVYGFPLDRSRDGKTLVAMASTQTAKVWEAPFDTPGKATQVTNIEIPLFNVVEAADRRLWAVSPDSRLWILNADGSQAMTYGDFRDVKGIASCGRFMLILHGGMGPLSLTRLDVDGRHPANLATGNLFAPFCSPDGKFAFYVTAAQPQKIWRVPVEGGAPVEITKILGDQVAGSPSISPDGSFISYAYEKFGPSLGPSLVVIPAAGGPPVKSFPMHRDAWEFSWAPDGTGLVFPENRDGVTNLWEQPLSGGKPKQVTKFTSGLIFDFSWSFDRKRVLFSHGEVKSDAVLLSNFR